MAKDWQETGAMIADIAGRSVLTACTRNKIVANHAQWVWKEVMVRQGGGTGCISELVEIQDLVEGLVRLCRPTGRNTETQAMVARTAQTAWTERVAGCRPTGL